MIREETPLKERDIFQNLLVTRTTDKFCFFGNKRLGWNKIKKLVESGEKINHYTSPNAIVNWTSQESVTQYHNSFNFWNTYISNASRHFEIHSGIFEVKNGLVFYEGEYYLPSPISTWEGNDNRWNSKQENIKSGKYNITLLKQENAWYPKEDINLRKNITLNLFLLGSKAKENVNVLKPNTTELWASQWGDGINFEYSRSTWDGLSFTLRSLNPISLFKKYFVKQRWGNGINIEITDSEIYKIMEPIENTLEFIISDALHNRKFSITIDENYGEISVSNMLQFDEDVAKKVFEKIENRLKCI